MQLPPPCETPCRPFHQSTHRHMSRFASFGTAIGMGDGPSANEWPNLKAMTILPGRVDIFSSQNGLINGRLWPRLVTASCWGGMTASPSPSYSFSVDSWLKESGASCFTPPGKRVAACLNGTHSRCDPSPTDMPKASGLRFLLLLLCSCCVDGPHESAVGQKAVRVGCPHLLEPEVTEG